MAAQAIGATRETASQCCKEEVSESGICKTEVETYALHLGMDLKVVRWSDQSVVITPFCNPRRSRTVVDRRAGPVGPFASSLDGSAHPDEGRCF
eukprot:8046548-Pyramimonas_sp.AAC.1